MENSIVLSIIVPVYNAEKYIERFVNNVVSAIDVPPFEIIFIDDGSEDNTINIIRKTQKKYHGIVFYEQEHQRQAVARNLGMLHAKGRFFSFLDIDDEFDANMFTKMFSAIPQHDLVITGIWRVLSKKNKVDESVSILQNATDFTDLISRYLVDRLEMDSGLWNKLFRAELIKDNGLQFTNKNFLEDTLFVFKYLLCIQPEKIAFINEPLYSYIKHEHTTTTLFQRDMDQLASSFVEEINAQLKRIAFKDRIAAVSGIKIRTFTYVLHRHILDDEDWTIGRQKKFYQDYLQVMPSEKKLVSKKYQIGLFLIHQLPNMYIHMYRLFKRIR
ncbi:glycosyltransferase family 2 protein [Loigolactobacillus zhaoyuanensis]|uniref:Glycosyltransferase family 2 protein n=1 Tax=Loigolactobacillus zhaoyuanensis TaxID=2486017 RepID=A0ABW8UGV8_9LACO